MTTKYIYKQAIAFAIAGFSLVSIGYAETTTQGDVDPDSGSSCLSLESTGLRYRATDAKTNGEVTLLQDFLEDQGLLKSPSRGFFGSATFTAVKQFQRGSDLTPTGYVGSLTRAKINEISCSGKTVSGTPDMPKQVVPPFQGEPRMIMCTMEARLCPNGQIMKRDDNCRWIESSCGNGGATTTNGNESSMRLYNSGGSIKPLSEAYCQMSSVNEGKACMSGTKIGACKGAGTPQAVCDISQYGPKQKWESEITGKALPPTERYGYDPLPPVRPTSTKILPRPLPIQIDLAPAGSGKLTDPVLRKEAEGCKMETNSVRLCPGGQPVPRDAATCAYRDDLCPRYDEGGMLCRKDLVTGKLNCGPTGIQETIQ